MCQLLVGLPAVTVLGVIDAAPELAILVHVETAEADIARGVWVDLTLGRVTLDEWSTRWLAGKRCIKPKTRADYESLLSAWILPTRHGYVARDLIDGIEMPRVISRERWFLSAAQVVELAESMPAKYRAIVYVVAYGGPRFSEAVALRHRRCDLLHGRLEIAEGAVDVKGELVWGMPKTHEIGSVSLPRFVVKVLEEHHDASSSPTRTLSCSPPTRAGRCATATSTPGFGIRSWRRRTSRHTCATQSRSGRRPESHPESDAPLDDLGDLRRLRPPGSPATTTRSWTAWRTTTRRPRRSGSVATSSTER